MIKLYQILIIMAVDFILLLGMFYILIALPNWLENWVGAILIICGGLFLIDKPVTRIVEKIFTVRNNK